MTNLTLVPLEIVRMTKAEIEKVRECYQHMYQANRNAFVALDVLKLLTHIEHSQDLIKELVKINIQNSDKIVKLEQELRGV